MSNKEWPVTLAIGAVLIALVSFSAVFFGLKFSLAFSVAAVAAFALSLPVERFALRIGAVDVPTERKVHAKAIPHLGGLVIYLSFLLAASVPYVLQKLAITKGQVEVDSTLAGILLGGTFILVWGLIDDVFNISPKTKFLAQIVAAIIIIFFGVQIEFVANPMGGLFYLDWLSYPVTIFWVVSLTNTVNLIDGLDGLAAGVCAIAFFTLSIFGFLRGATESAFLCFVLVGSSLGFLRHNFNPARIFMGDSGSMFLGFMLGAITAQGIMKSVAVLAFLVPVIVMGVPIFDTAFAILRRSLNKRPVSQADKEHIHHRLLYRGLTHRRTVVIIYLWSAVLSAVALILMIKPMRFTSSNKLLVLLALGVATFVLARYSGLLDWLRRKEHRPRHLKQR